MSQGENWFCGDLLTLQPSERQRTVLVLACVDDPGHHPDTAHRSGTAPLVRWRTNRHDPNVRDVWVEQSDDFYSTSASGIWDLPEIQVTRGAVRFPAPAAAGAEPGASFAGADLSATGWCPPSETLYSSAISPELAEQIAYETRPCNGEHRWERCVSSSQCGCFQCEYTERHVECAGCPAVVRAEEAGFEEVWEAAPWP